MTDDKNPIVESEELADRNLWLWRINETTDEEHTKKVKLGRSFTSIDPHYQVKRATETFGPVGIGWGWDLEEEVVLLQGKDGEISLLKAKVTIWYRNPKNDTSICHCGPVIGMNMISTGGRVDDDAGKKAVTDALTKGLSYLGFSADVFMGLYDDVKYIEQLRRQANQKLDATGQRLPELLTKAVAQLPSARDLDEVTIMWKSIQAELRQLNPAQLDFMKARFARRRSQLAPPSEPNGEAPQPGEAP